MMTHSDITDCDVLEDTLVEGEALKLTDCKALTDPLEDCDMLGLQMAKRCQTHLLKEKRYY